MTFLYNIVAVLLENYAVMGINSFMLFAALLGLCQKTFCAKGICNIATCSHVCTIFVNDYRSVNMIIEAFSQ